jgi:hypothetical protein
MAGLVPAIHVFELQIQVVDARDERGHDESTAIPAIPSDTQNYQDPGPTRRKPCVDDLLTTIRPILMSEQHLRAIGGVPTSAAVGGSSFLTRSQG